MKKATLTAVSIMLFFTLLSQVELERITNTNSNVLTNHQSNSEIISKENNHSSVSSTGYFWIDLH